MALSVIEKIQRRTKRISNGKDSRVRPGQTERFTAAAVVGDAIRQGDLYLVVSEAPPEHFIRVDRPKDTDRQLVPGNTTGAKHCLDSLEGVEMWRPKDWSEESLDGPVVRLSRERTVMHPTHGAVVLIAGMTFACHYQREWDREQEKERRARD